MYGTTSRFDWSDSKEPSPRGVGINQLETSAAAYTGILATLVVAPLGLANRRYRAMNCFWAFLSLFALSWCLNVPGLVQLLRLPGLNMMSHNRMVFLASFAILAMSAVGLETLLQGPFQWRRWFWIPLLLLAGLCAFCIYRSTSLPEPLDSKLAQLVLEDRTFSGIESLEGVHQLQAQFTQYFFESALWCGAGVVAWLVLRSKPASRVGVFGTLGLLLLGDLLWFGYGRNVQCEPTLYFPRIPALQQLAEARPIRIVGSNCLPPALAEICGLREVRGYDGVDPQTFMELLTPALDPKSLGNTYAITLFAAPGAALTPEGDIRLSPILDLLGVNYVIFRGEPLTNSRPAFQSPDYWVLRNPAALPRFFVPQRVETVADKDERLQKLTSPQFNPRQVAYVEVPVELPASSQGEASIIEESPTRLILSVKMVSDGLGVLADFWDKGWRAYLNGKPVPILRTNHALRGVILPAGTGTLEFRYEPASYRLGLKLAALAGLTLLAFVVGSIWRSRKPMPNAERISKPEIRVN
jgi:hypothetical protein